DRALALRLPGPYQLQAAIAALHAEPETDWREIALLYGRLLELTPSPVIELNRAVAVAMARGEAEGLALVDAIEGLDDYYLLHAASAGGGVRDARAAPRRRTAARDVPACRPAARPRHERRLRRPYGSGRDGRGNADRGLAGARARARCDPTCGTCSRLAGARA